MEGIDQKGGYARANAGQGIFGEPGDHNQSFWHTTTPDLLSSSPAIDTPEGEPTRLVEGTHTFSFTLDVPETFVPSTSTSSTGSLGRKTSLKAKVGSLFGRRKSSETAEAKPDVVSPEPAAIPEEGEALGAIQLPPSFLRHQQGKMGEVAKQHAQDTGIIAAEYTIGVHIKFAGRLTPDMSVEQGVVILPLKDQELSPSSSRMPSSGVQA
ncbi:hypothetical protein DL93DRAFT_1856573 [Clavulina sp. PMI_390]|nr:hypothetical protein DL93DRAFT_1856573 [Clavulina sp. PMI_390]